MKFPWNKYDIFMKIHKVIEDPGGGGTIHNLGRGTCHREGYRFFTILV